MQLSTLFSEWFYHSVGSSLLLRLRILVSSDLGWTGKLGKLEMFMGSSGEERGYRDC